MKIISIRLLSIISLSTSLMMVLFLSPLQAQEKIRKNQDDNLARSTTLITQNLTTIMGVRINQTPEGLELVLETPANSNLQPLIYPQENALIIDIFDAVLTLPEGEEFKVENPTDDITEVKVTKLDDNSTRITITGKTNVPMAQIVPSPSNLILSLTPSQAPKSEEESEIEIVATQAQQENNYIVPNATTATRTDTPIMDIPQSVQVIPQQVIRDQGAINVREVLRNVSGVTLSSTSGSRREDFIIRGFSATQFINGIRDDFYSSRTRTDLANIERIEVVKGPASVLFGQAEPSGIINFVTKQPLLEPYYDFSFTAGSYDFYRPTIDISGPLTKNKSLSYRLNIAYENAGSFRDRVHTERIFIAPTIAWQITPDTKLSYEYSYLYDQRPVDRGLVVLSDNQIPNIPIGRYLGDPEIQEQFTEQRSTVYFDHKFNPNLSLRSIFRYTYANEGGPGCTLQIFGGSEDDRNFPISECIGNQDYETWTWQNDLIGKFNTGSVKHTLLFGTEYSRQWNFYEGAFRSAGTIDIFNPSYDFIFGEFDPPGIGNNQVTSFGIYLQDQINILDNLILVLGGRFDTYEDNGQFDGVPYSTNADAFSPRVGLVYQPIPEVSVYASFSQSFTPVSGTNVNGNTFEPQRGTGYEIGVKGELLEGRLMSTFALYDTTLRNILTEDPDNPGFSIQVGSQRSQGIELDIAGEILPGWKIIASYGLTNAEIAEDNTYPSGNRLNNVPTNTASLWTTYTIQKGNLEGLGFGTGIFYVSNRAGDLDNSFYVPSYTLVDAAIYYQKDQFRAALNFKNLFNTRYFDASQSRTVVQPGSPFTILGSFSINF
jgi:iron complex outermembrane receptor protein